MSDDAEGCSLDTVGILTRAYREDVEGTIPYYGVTRLALQNALLRSFLAGGGNYRPAEAMDGLSVELNRACSEGDFRFLTPDFYKFSGRLRPAQRRAVINWAKAVPDGHPNHGIAQAVLLGFGLHHLAECLDPEVEAMILREATLASALEILRDDSISRTWRIGFAALLGDSIRDEAGPEIAKATGDLLVGIFNQMQPCSATCFSKAMPLFLRGDESDPKWKETGKLMLEAWRSRQQYNNETTKMGRAFKPTMDWIVPMMDLVCRLRDREAVRWNLLKFRRTYKTAPGVMVHLVREGFHKEAQGLLFGEAIDRNYRSDHFKEETVYSRELHDALPAFLASISNPHSRDFAELIVISIEDPDKIPDDPALTFPAQQERFDQFFESREDIPPTGDDDERKARMLEILTISRQNPKIEAILAKHQVGFLNRLDQDELDLGGYWSTRVEVHSAVENLVRGEDFPIQFAWGRAIFEDNDDFERYRRNTGEAMTDMLEFRLRLGCNDRDPDRLRRMLPAMRTIVGSMPDNIYHEDVHRLLVRFLGAHAYAGQIGEYDQWWDGLDPKLQQHFVDLLEKYTSLVAKTDEQFNLENRPPEVLFETDEIRRQTLQGIFSSQWVSRGYHGKCCLAYAHGKSLVTEEDIYEIAGHIANRAPRGGSAYREWLGSLADRGKLEQALVEAEAALLKFAPDSPDEAGVWQALQIERMLILETLGRKDEVQFALAEFQENGVENQLPPEYGDEVIAAISGRAAE
ncbi:MAG: hypothetical protein HKN23_09025 [Verrucomicrobiales bacterium]|nr:hypothetical protein [Verrucomicrobiales bacterium]